MPLKRRLLFATQRLIQIAGWCFGIKAIAFDFPIFAGWSILEFRNPSDAIYSWLWFPIDIAITITCVLTAARLLSIAQKWPESHR